MMEPQTGTYCGQGGLEHLKGYYFLCIKKGEGRLEASGNCQAVMLSAANAAFPDRSLRAGTSDLHWQKPLEKRWLCGMRVILSSDAWKQRLSRPQDLLGVVRPETAACALL